MSDKITRSDTVTVWSRGCPGSHWLVERSYPLHYVLDWFQMSKHPGVAHKFRDDNRWYCWLPHGTQLQDPVDGTWTYKGATQPIYSACGILGNRPPNGQIGLVKEDL